MSDALARLLVLAFSLGVLFGCAVSRLAMPGAGVCTTGKHPVVTGQMGQVQSRPIRPDPVLWQGDK